MRSRRLSNLALSMLSLLLATSAGDPPITLERIITARSCHSTTAASTPETLVNLLEVVRPLAVPAP